MADLRWSVSQGNATSKAASELRPGEFVGSTGAIYLPGFSDRIWKQSGRATFGDTGAAAKVKGLVLAQYDDGADRLLAFSGDTIYSATPGLTGSFASLITGLDSDADHLSAAHAFDRWYLADGVNPQNVVESDGTAYAMGLQAPQEAMLAVAAAGFTASERPSTASGFTNSANAIDTDSATFASGSRTTAGTTTLTLAGFPSDVTLGRVLMLEWGLAVRGRRESQLIGDLGGQSKGGFLADVKIEISEDGGTTYTTRMNARYSRSQDRQVFQRSITVNSTLVFVKISLIYRSGGNIVTLQSFDNRIDVGSSTANVTSSAGGMDYAVTEYDETRGEESPWSPFTNVVLAAQNRVDLTLPTAARNSRATHWRVYRTADAGTAPQDLGLIGQVPIADTTFRDDFLVYPYNDQPTQIVPLLAITVNNEPLYFARDNPAPIVSWLSYFKGSLVGIQGRAAYYSIPGLPGSWPEIYVIDSFPFPEHDNLVRHEEVGGTLVFFATGAVFRVDTLPRVVQGYLEASEVIPLRGAPGLVGEYGAAAFSINGEPRVAWVAQDGIYVTNGHQYERVTKGMDWAPFEGLDKSGWLLHWDQKRQVLIFAYPTLGTENNRYWTGSFATEHLNDGQPKWTGPHYGSIASAASGTVSNSRRLYAGHSSDGVVYLEDYGGVDDSLAYDAAGTWPLILTTGKVHSEYDEWAVMRGNLRHGDFGAGQTCTLTWRAGRDGPAPPQTRSLSVSLATEKGTEFDVARSGDWLEWTLTHTGTGVSWIQDMRLEVQRSAMSGTASAVGP